MNRPIRVLELGSALGLYGAERWILALTKNLNQPDIDPVVGVIRDHPSQSAELCRKATAMGLTTVIFEAAHPYDIRIVQTIRDYVVKNSIDIVHTHGYKQDAAALMAAKGTRCKVISTPHGWTRNPDVKLRFFETCDRLLFNFMDAVVPLSRHMYDRLCAIPGMRKRLRMIENGVDLEEIDTFSGAISELQELRIHSRFIIGYVGRLIPGKGLEILLRALARMNDGRTSVAIIGDGPDEPKLRELSRQLGIAEKVHFFGYRADRIGFLKEFTLFVLPSESEGLPRCLMEAMAAGIMVVASDIPGCRALVRDGETGRLFKPGDADSLALIIREMLDRPNLRKAMAAAGCNYVRQHHSARRMASDYESLYMEFASRES